MGSSQTFWKRLTDLSDVEISNVQDGDYIGYDAATGTFVNTATAGVISLNEISDVSLDTATERDALIYNSTSGLWENVHETATRPYFQIGQLITNAITPYKTLALTGTGNPILAPYGTTGVQGSPPDWHGFEFVYDEIWSDYTTGQGDFCSTNEDGTITFDLNGRVLILATMNLSHSQNTSVVGGAVFRVRDSEETFYPPVTSARLPNLGEPGTMTLVGMFPCLAGDRFGMGFATDTTGTITFYSSTFCAMMVGTY